MHHLRQNKFGSHEKGQFPITQDLLLPILTFLRKSGISQSRLLTECRSAIRQAGASKSQLELVRIGLGYANSSIVDRGLRDPSFLNHARQPALLSIRGAPIISSLLT